jgi:hypothetical protein
MRPSDGCRLRSLPIAASASSPFVVLLLAIVLLGADPAHALACSSDSDCEGLTSDNQCQTCHGRAADGSGRHCSAGTDGPTQFSTGSIRTVIIVAPDGCVTCDDTSTFCKSNAACSCENKPTGMGSLQIKVCHCTSESELADQQSSDDNFVMYVGIGIGVCLCLAVLGKMSEDSDSSTSSSSQQLSPAPAPAPMRVQPGSYAHAAPQFYTPPVHQAATSATTVQRCGLCGVQYVDPWQERPHTSSGRTQYVNSNTGEMLWTRPQVHTCQQVVVTANPVAGASTAGKFCANCGARGSETNFCEGCGSRM